MVPSWFPLPEALHTVVTAHFVEVVFFLSLSLGMSVYSEGRRMGLKTLFLPFLHQYLVHTVPFSKILVE